MAEVVTEATELFAEARSEPGSGSQLTMQTPLFLMVTDLSLPAAWAWARDLRLPSEWSFGLAGGAFLTSE